MTAKKTGPQLVVHDFTPPDDVDELARRKLASSGLTVADAKRLGVTWLSAAAARALDKSFYNVPMLKIPYYRPDATRTPLSAGPGWPEFYRVRTLRDPAPLPENYKKYSQPPGRGNICAYFPFSFVDWAVVARDPGQPLIITEGELKAAKASAEGFPAIGLGGKDRSKSDGRVGRGGKDSGRGGRGGMGGKGGKGGNN